MGEARRKRTYRRSPTGFRKFELTPREPKTGHSRERACPRLGEGPAE